MVSDTLRSLFPMLVRTIVNEDLKTCRQELK